MKQIREGSVVLVKGGFNTETAKEVKIEGIGEKNGYVVFDYDTQPNGTGRWAYEDQIIKVIKY